MNYRTDFNRVAGLGSAKDGVRHWWFQRLTSVALIPLTFIFVFAMGSSLGGGHQSVTATFANPFIAVSTLLFLIAGFHHLQQGLQVVIEDYVHSKRLATGCFVLNILLCWTFAVIGIFAVVRLSLGIIG